MAMQHTPLLMANILDRGAKVAPNEEIVTATADGVRKQSYLETRNRSHQLAHALRDSCLLYTSPSPRDRTRSRMPSSA